MINSETARIAAIFTLIMKKTLYRYLFALLAITPLSSTPFTIAHAQEPVVPPTASPSPTASVATPPQPIPDTQKRLELSVTLTDGTKAVKLTRQELGFSLVSEAPVQFAIDKAQLKKALASVSDTFAAEAVDARPVIYKGTFSVKPGSFSRALNVPTTAEKIIQSVTSDPATRKFTVTLTKKAPVLTAERLEGITGKLSEFSSIAVGTASRDNNIAIAVDHIDGTLLSPGEVFSLNDIVGERTKARGFQEAHVFVDAKVVNGLGGGVSQVTGTLFNAAALAGLKIVEVNPHSRPVAYLPLGRDATVAYGAKDLKFKNTTSAPIYIRYTFTRSRLVATLWGAPTAGRTVSLRPTVQRLGPGKINAQLYRVIKENGQIVSKERLLSHGYRWKPGED